MRVVSIQDDHPDFPLDDVVIILQFERHPLRCARALRAQVQEPLRLMHAELQDFFRIVGYHAPLQKLTVCRPVDVAAQPCRIRLFHKRTNFVPFLIAM